jgi:Ca-activated chloride channel homolog
VGGTGLEGQYGMNQSTRLVHAASAAGLLALGIASVAHAQLFRTGVDMVALTVTVTDPKGHSIKNLSAGDFTVLEEGVEQQITVFGREEVPVDVALVLDTSASMDSVLPLVKSGARGLLSELRSGDRVSVVDVKTTVRTVAPLPAEGPEAAAAIDRLAAVGATALYDGIYMALRQFERERRLRPELRRQALVVFSDGIDTASHIGFEEINDFARALDVTIYPIALQPPAVGRTHPHAERLRQAAWEMRTLARETGGVPFFPTEPTELATIYDRIAGELVSQYALGYVSSADSRAPAFRRVSIRLVEGGVARTRAGYSAGRTSSW